VVVLVNPWQPVFWTINKNPSNKCYKCGKPGHCAKDCHSKKKVKDKNRDKAKGKSNGEGSGGKVKNQETNFVNEEIMFAIDNGLYTFTDDEDAYNFNNQNDCTSEGNDNCLIYYDWLQIPQPHLTSHVHEATLPLIFQ
jgi:hypothetical protein